jgi:hypothetical protein
VSHEDPRLVALSDGHDHIRADAALLRGRIGRGDIASARRCFDAFSADLEAHMADEENGVFATLATMDAFAPTIARLRAEHDRARRAVIEARAEQDDRVWCATVEALLAGFALHELEEEYDLFPAAELALPVGPKPPVRSPLR